MNPEDDQPDVVLVHGKSGVVGYASVDRDDLDRANEYRWRLDAKGYVRAHGYLQGRRVNVFLHRLVLRLEPGDERVGDHINGDRLDNRRANLRAVTQAQNAQNRRSDRDGLSRFRGVYYDSRQNRWRATGRLDGRARAVGSFTCEIEAAVAAEAFRREHMPFAEPDPELIKALAERTAA
jgi:hypothetical protein